MIALAGRKKKINAQRRKTGSIRGITTENHQQKTKFHFFLNSASLLYSTVLRKIHVNPKYLLSVTITHTSFAPIPPTRNKKEWHQGKRRPPTFLPPTLPPPAARLYCPAFLAYLANPQPKVDSTLQPSTNAIPAPPFSKTTPRARLLHLRLPPLPTSIITTSTTTTTTTHMHLPEYLLLPPSSVWGVLDLQHRIPGTFLNTHKHTLSLCLSLSLSISMLWWRKGRLMQGAGGGVGRGM